jgi:hypothetical protein
VFVSLVSKRIRNTETNRKNVLLVSRNKPKINRNRLSFGLFRFEPKINFVCFEDTLSLEQVSHNWCQNFFLLSYGPSTGIKISVFLHRFQKYRHTLVTKYAPKNYSRKPSFLEFLAGESVLFWNNFLKCNCHLCVSIFFKSTQKIRLFDNKAPKKALLLLLFKLPLLNTVHGRNK